MPAEQATTVGFSPSARELQERHKYKVDGSQARASQSHGEAELLRQLSVESSRIGDRSGAWSDKLPSFSGHPPAAQGSNGAEKGVTEFEWS